MIQLRAMSRRYSPAAVLLAVLLVLGVAVPLYASSRVLQTATIYDLDVTSDAAVFTSSLAPSKAASIFLVTVKLTGTDATIQPTVTRGAATKTIPLNGTTGNLTAGVLYTFSFMAPSAADNEDGSGNSALTYNVKFSASTTVDLLSICEQVNER